VGVIGAIWGLFGVLLLLGSAVYRLSRMAVAAFDYDFGPVHWIALVVIVLLMAYAEGYRGFQQRFSPRVAARALFLKQHPRFLHAVFAPFFCMGYFYATPKRQRVSIALTLGIVVLVILVRFLPQPWRGILDAGVVVGLAWGVLSLLYFSGQAFTRPHFPFPPEVPEAE